MTPVREFYSSPKSFLPRILVFCAVVLVFVVAPSVKRGEVSTLVVPLAVIGFIVAASLIYLYFRSSKPRIRLSSDGIEGEHGLITWDDVEELSLTDLGSETTALALQLNLKDGSTLYEDLEDLDSPPRDVYQQALNAFQERENAGA